MKEIAGRIVRRLLNTSKTSKDMFFLAECVPKDIHVPSSSSIFKKNGGLSKVSFFRKELTNKVTKIITITPRRFNPKRHENILGRYGKIKKEKRREEWSD